MYIPCGGPVEKQHDNLIKHYHNTYIKGGQVRLAQAYSGISQLDCATLLFLIKRDRVYNNVL